MIVSSPDGQINARVYISKGKLVYDVIANKVKLITSSRLGLTVDGSDLGADPQFIAGPSSRKIRENYDIYGSHKNAHNEANEITIPVISAKKPFKLILRAYNDGVAIRYTLPGDAKYINADSTTWNFSGKVSQVAWSELNSSYEGLSHVTSLQSVPQAKPIMGPLTFDINGFFASISEADCEDFSDMSFIRNENSFIATFPYAPAGWTIRPRADSAQAILNGTYDGQKVSPWRTTIIARNLTELVNSDLLMNLCPAPQKGSDFSWVEPGRCLWQWWSVGAPKFADQKNWYDAAARLKWEYYLVDDGWRNWKEPGKDQWQLLGEVIDYGKSIGVKTLVWANSNEMRSATTRYSYLKRIKDLGASGIKIDFIPDATSSIMQWYMAAMEDCAALKLILNFHGAVKPTGLTRTFPVNITREAVRGNEYHMSRYKRVAPFEQDVSLPFTRLMAGAADFTPVILDPEQLLSQKFTWAHQFAQAIVYLSPITHFADNYKFYLASQMFDLFQEIPTTWDETRVLNCTKMGEIVAFARRKGNTWWVGVMNGANASEVKIPLNFLAHPTKGTLVYDGVNNVSINRQEQLMKPADTLTLQLSPGGGFVAKL
ncbi:glycoside hydrolase family 97 protein [Mucilaginibacter sp. PPCGB 2223]|uniref:glycoside hydrolase family 97 protein n=1 Tax=Mucilaginibacter sp. PPCGB 2223 TaxID=1886027 RepID=UPI0020C7851E|nr:glycoside hydrolase family 97 protein [Mucilaginibacter sp. PPCGB 2223]